MSVLQQETFDWHMGQWGNPAMVIATGERAEDLVEVRRRITEAVSFD